MISSTPISQIMTKEVIVIDKNDSLIEVERIFGNHSLRHAPVLHQGELVGMLSLVDLRRNLQAEPSDVLSMRAARVEELMTSDPVSLQTNATIQEVATLFTEGDFHAIPILDGDQVVGIVSTTDVIKFLMESVSDLENDA
jgi:predicted transcriptional regulator